MFFSPFSLRAALVFLSAMLLSSVLAGFVSRVANAGRDAHETPCAAQETAVLTVRIACVRTAPDFLTHANA